MIATGESESPNYLINFRWLGRNAHGFRNKAEDGYAKFPIRVLYPKDMGVGPIGRGGVREIRDMIIGPIPSGMTHIIKGKPSWNGQGYTGPAYYLQCTNSFDVVLLQPSVPGGCIGPNNIARRKIFMHREWYRYLDTGALFIISMPVDAVLLLLLGVAASAPM